MDCIFLVRDRDKRRAVVKAVMNLRVPENAGNFVTSWGYCSLLTGGESSRLCHGAGIFQSLY